MADIRVPDVNMAALAALAGTRSPSLHLASPADAVLENRKLDIEQQRADQAASAQFQNSMTDMMRSTMADSRAGQELAMRQQERASNMSLDREKLAMQQKNIDADNARLNKSSEMDAKYKEALISKLHAEADKESREKSRDALKGMLMVSTAISSMPLDKLEENKVGVIGAAVKSGLIDEDQGKSLAGMNASQINTLSRAGLFVSTNALKLQMAREKEAAKANSGTEIYDPNTGQLVYRSGPNKELNKKVAAADADLLKGYTEDANKADESLASINMFRGANKEFETGLMAPVKVKAGQALRSVGLDDPFNAPAGEALKGLSMDFILKRIANTKGSISDREMSAFAEASPNLLNTSKGNEKLLNGLEAASRRVVEKANFMREWGDKRGSLSGATEAWKNFVNDNPVVSDDMKTINSDNLSNWRPYLEDSKYRKASNEAITGRDGKSYSMDVINKYAKDNNMSVDDVLKRIK